MSGALSIRPVEPADTQAVGDVFLAALAGMKDDGRVIGFVALTDDVIYHLWVHPDQQNRGVGTALLAHARERRPSGLQLRVFQQNTGARRLYERHGFKLVRLADGSGNDEGQLIFKDFGLSSVGEAGSFLATVDGLDATGCD